MDGIAQSTHEIPYCHYLRPAGRKLAEHGLGGGDIGPIVTHFVESLRQGHYAKKQIFCQDWLISWSHRSRFETGVRLAAEFGGKKILDYGCGDGTFLAMLFDGSFPPSQAVGAELDRKVIESHHARFKEKSRLKFVFIKDLYQREHRGVYDGIFCMEVLEHIVEPEKLLDRFQQLLAPAGKLVISVPVETGFPLIVKQSVRTIAGWRKLGDYPGTASYTFTEYWQSLFAGNAQHIERPVYGIENGSPFHDHKGFNWMWLRGKIADRFIIEKIFGSPVPWLPPRLNSQIWFIAHKKTANLPESDVSA